MPLLFLSSPCFKDLQSIPKEYSCLGKDISPELVWSAPPKNTKSFALTVVDPDAPGGDFIHWVIYNIPAETDHLMSNIPKKSLLDNGTMQGMNDFGFIGYGGPCPPPRQTHSYIFTLYALDIKISLSPGASYGELQNAVKGHSLAESKLTGYFCK